MTPYIMTPAELIQHDLKSHPALLDFLKNLLEANFDCMITYAIADPNSFMGGLGWNYAPKIRKKGGETYELRPMEAHEVATEGILGTTCLD